MWIIVPLIVVLSWRFSHRIGQAFNETAAWVLGYLWTAGVILLLDYGGSDLVSATPNDPGAMLAIIGGFVGMWVSPRRWKRRGGHLEPVDNRFTRAWRAMRSAPPVSKPKAGGTSSSSAVTRGSQSIVDAEWRDAAGERLRAGSQTAADVSRNAAHALRATSAKSGNRWARALAAMLDSESSSKPKRGG